MPKLELENAPSKAASYTEPFGLVAQLKPVSARLDWLPMIDLLVLVLLFGLMFTRFVMVPGVRVDLPGSSMEMQPSQHPVAVLTIGHRGMLFFDGAVFELNSIQRGFEQLIASSSEEAMVLLVKSDGTMDLQRFLHLCRMAQEAGFTQVQIAGKKPEQADSALPIRDTGVRSEEGFFSAN